PPSSLIHHSTAIFRSDLPAEDAVLQLYRNGVLVTRIQRAFSLGMFGESKRRKLVPTRWSITAVDSNLSLKLMARVRHHPHVDELDRKSTRLNSSHGSS